MVDGLGDSLISAGLTTAVYGGKFGDNFKGAFQSSLAMTALADVQRGIGDFAKASGIAEGSSQHVILHALAGCIGAAAAGGDCAAGAAAGAVQSIYAGTLQGSRLSDNAQQLNAQLFGGLAAAFASGGDAAATMLASNIALSGMANNRQLHREEAEWIRNNASDLARELGVSIETAQAMLTGELLRRVSDDFDGRIALDQRVSDFIDANAPQGLVVDGQNLFAVLDRSSAEYQNSTINMDAFLGQNSIADLYMFDTRDGLALQTGISGAAIDLTNFSGTYTRVQEGDFLTAGLGITLQLGHLGQITGNVDIQNSAEAIQRQLVQGYVGGDFGGQVFGGQPYPDQAGFDIFDYYANENVSGLSGAAGLGWGLGRGLAGSNVLQGVGSVERWIARLPDNGVDYDTVSTAGAGQSKFPRDLNEQMLFNQVQANPLMGRTLNGMNNGTRFLASDGFQKMELIRELPDGSKISLHYQYSALTGRAYDVKVTSPQLVSSVFQQGASITGDRN